MMTSSNGNIFRVTGHLCGGFTGPRWIPRTRPVTRSFDVFLDLRLNKRLSKQSWGWWFETLSRPLWRHRNVPVFYEEDVFLYNSSVQKLAKMKICYRLLKWMNITKVKHLYPSHTGQPTRNRQKPQHFHWIGQLSAIYNVAEDTIKPDRAHVRVISGKIRADLRPISNQNDTDWRPIFSTILES